MSPPAALSRFDPTAALAAEMVLAIAGLVLTALLLAAGRGAAARHGVWLSALAAVLLCPLGATLAHGLGLRLVTLSWPAQRPVPEPPPTSPSQRPAARLEPPGAGPTTVATEPTAVTPQSKPPVVLAVRPAPPAERAAMSVEAIQPPDRPPVALGTRLLPAAFWSWAAGALALLARLVRGGFVVRALRRSARPMGREDLGSALEQARSDLGLAAFPPVVVSREIRGPVVLGVLRPLILLPEGLTEQLEPDALRDVLVHEAVHLLRRDPLIGLLQRLAELLYWPHPLVHLLNRRLSRAREEVCDNFVLRDGDPCRFAQTLLMLAEGHGGPDRLLGSLPLLNAGWNLEDRVAGLLNPGRKTMTRLDRGAVAAIALVLLSAGVGLAGLRVGEPAPADDPPAPAVSPTRKIEGIVTDVEGKPVQGASVRLVRPWRMVAPATSDAAGRFKVQDRGPLTAVGEALIATRDEGGRTLMGLGLHHDPLDGTLPREVRIRLEPPRSVVTTVADAKGTPVAGATVAVVGDNGTLATATTGADGRATLRYPAAAKVPQITASKAGLGMDYFENYANWPPSEYPDLPAAVSLVLDGAVPRSLKAVDAAGQPVAGLRFYAWAFQKQGKLSHAFADLTLSAVTNAEGVATFDSVPRVLEHPGSVGLLPEGPWHAPRVALHAAGDPNPIGVRVERNVVLRGRVLDAAGKPAAGILVHAGGVGPSIADEYEQGYARTDAGGNYAIEIAPGHAYMVTVQDRDRAARSLSGIVPRREGEAYPLPDLRLVPGTLISGRLTRGPEKTPLADAFISVQEFGEPIPRDFQSFTWEGLEWISRFVRTDREGRYAIRVGPGGIATGVSAGRKT